MLTGKTALITGGGQGVGQGIGLALAKQGANIVVTGRTLEKCETTAELLRGRGVKALALRCDVKSADDLQNSVDKTIACLLYTSPSPRDRQKSRMPSSA